LNEYTLIIQGGFIVIIPYMSQVYFEQVHALHCILISPCSLLFQTVFGRFNYAVFQHTHVVHFNSLPSSEFIPFPPTDAPWLYPLSHSCPIIVIIITSISSNCHHFRSRVHKWVKTCYLDFWAWLISLKTMTFSSTHFPFSIFLQITEFHFYLWLRNILWYIYNILWYIYYIYIYHIISYFLYPLGISADSTV
jgi:hypothetical protein